ncbi:hypothetical protein IW261DRAFT_1419516 [Armillaria novae-zelandiae]|uniref:Uncharacterized protein n=1 Tax=Armillaria novae-zelandiae TaxID=153914 RepID=A0AA39P9X9_9AGAR|nr:hypothetical protein IW261DRAFT_1419516 [Armillaria novae-zelandiae]
MPLVPHHWIIGGAAGVGLTPMIIYIALGLVGSVSQPENHVKIASKQPTAKAYGVPDRVAIRQTGFTSVFLCTRKYGLESPRRLATREKERIKLTRARTTENGENLELTGTKQPKAGYLVP